MSANQNKLKTSIVFLCLLISQLAFAQKSNSPWVDFKENALMQNDPARQVIPQKYRTVALQRASLDDILNTAPQKHSPEAETADVRLSLPMPDGTEEEFRIVYAPIMSKGLAARYPAIRSFAGQGIDDPTAYVRFGLTHRGFHAMILSARHSTVFIDSYAKNDTEHYISYYKSDYERRAEDDFSCHTEGETKQEAAQKTIAGNNLFVAGGDCQLRTYRLALACTQEYANFHGGTVPAVMDEYNVAMARVNGIYETDFAVTMVLVDNTDDIIYLNEPDPFTNNQGGTMLGQNQTTCDNEIGNANYDIGHVFSTGGGGIAGLGVPCLTNQKARGVTGLGSPVNDPFYVDYVAHEMGHQFGANHTFNNSCGGNRNNATAMEPGSASTIMGYAGICAPNVQNNSDAYFHAVSLIEVYNYITVGGGSGCPTTVNNPNNPPVITVENTNYTIPGNTPFFLTAAATDPDGGNLTYCWEQMDNEISPQAPQGTNTGGPNFRSLDPTESPTRYFPSLDNILNGTNDTWEVLPTVSRSMEFRCVVRDNNMGEGCTDEADVDIEVDGNAGPFTVLNPNTNLTWLVGENQTVTWDVAGTNAAPISCDNVDIMLSIDGGNTYPITLASSVPNTGSFTVPVPNNTSTSARVMIFCSDNIFFDISDENFTIDEPAQPTFVFAATPATAAVCNDGTATYNLDFTALAGFNEGVTLTATGLPSGASADFSQNPITPTGSSIMTVSNLNGATAGTYTITVNANSSSVNNSTTVELNLSTGIPLVQNLTTPADNETGVSIITNLSWEALPGATAYNVRVSSTPDFTDVIFDGNTATNSITTTELDEESVYYWQVSATNACGTGTYSAYNAFQTGAIACQTYESTNVPVNLPDDEAGEITSTLTIDEDIVFSDVDVNVFIRHTWLGDLSATLTSPAGTTVSLFEQPGVPADQYGCNQDDINVTLDDDASNTAEDLDNTCEGTTPAIEGTFQAVGDLSAFNGQNAQGTWTLTVTDAFGEDGGQLDSWSIFGCNAGSVAPAAPTLSTDDLSLAQGATEDITNINLQASATGNSAEQLTYTILTLPANGTLLLNGTALLVGSTFTQADINTGQLSYMHDNSATNSDNFSFSVQTAQGGWLPQGNLNIVILQNNLAASAQITGQIACNGDENGSLEATVSGGNEPFSYSIDGENFQPSPIFSGLAAGTYTVTVRDDFGFEVQTNAITITQPELINADNTINGNTITIDAEGGTGNLTYSIDGTNYQASNVFDNLSNGTYNVCVRDENDCEICKEEVIAVNNVTASAVITTEILCANEETGVITVNVGGGQEPYSYSINGSTAQSSNVFSFLPSGEYTVTVQDAEGFSINTNTITLNNPNPIISNPSVNGSTITVNANGGTGNLSYSINGIDYQASNEFTDVPNGSYEVCTQDENDCEVCSTVVVAVDMMVVSANLTQNITCHDANNGIITVNAAGGNAPYSYSLNGMAAQDSNVFTDLAANTYSIEVTDNSGAVLSTNEITITNPEEISVSTAVNSNIVTITANGGTGNLTYSIDGTNYQSSNVFSGLSNGTYQVCARDANNCQVCEQAIVAVNGLLVNAVVSQDISCADANDGTITVTAAGGNEPYSYRLNGTGTPQASNIFTDLSAAEYFIEVTDNDGFVLNSNSVTITNPTALSVEAAVNGFTVTLTGQGGTGTYQYSTNGTDYTNNNSFVLSENGTYTFYVIDENGCVATVETTVGVNQISAVLSEQTAISCAGGNNGCILVQVTGANAPIQYTLNGTTQTDDNIFCGLSAGEYEVTVTDADGFSFTTTPIVLEQPNFIDFDYSVVCDLITIEAAGGTGDLVFTLNDNVIESTSSANNGTYTLAVQDANGCTLSNQITVNDINSAEFETEDPTCFDEDNGSLTVSSVEGGTPNYEYSINGTDFQTTNSFNNLAAAVYQVTVRDAAGCEVTESVSVNAPNALTATTDVMNTTITVNASGGTGDLMYSIDGINFQDNNVFNDLPAGTYTVTIIDENDCSTTVETSILTSLNDFEFNLEFAVNPNPNNGSFNLLINMPTERDLIVRIYDVAGKEIFRNVFVKNGIFFSQNINLDALSSGSYFVTVHDGKLSGTKEVIVIQ